MNHQAILALLLGVIVMFQDPGRDPPSSQGQRAFTHSFGEDAADLAPTGRNAYFVLEPGYTLVLEGGDQAEPVRITITVLDETERIDGVETRAVEEREVVGGETKEVTRDYFAISRRTGNVYYFGEDVDEYRDGKVVGHPGAWLAGEQGARYGLMMPAVPLLGSRYYQEVAPEVAMDRAEVVSLAESFACPAGAFDHVLKVEETTPLERGEREYKLYAPGVGLLSDEGLRLVRYGKQAAPAVK